MPKRYLVFYVGDDSRDTYEVVWAANREQAVAKVKAKGGEMVKVVKRMASPLALLSIYLGVALLIVLLIVQIL